MDMLSSSDLMDSIFCSALSYGVVHMPSVFLSLICTALLIVERRY